MEINENYVAELESITLWSAQTYKGGISLPQTLPRSHTIAGNMLYIYIGAAIGIVLLVAMVVVAFGWCFQRKEDKR